MEAGRNVLSRLYLGTSDIKTIIILAIPAILENFLHVFIGVADMFFVGKLGPEAIAAVGAANLIMNIYLAFFLAIGVGATAIVARNVGAGNLEAANKAVKHAVVIALALGLLCGLASFVFGERLLLMLGTEARVMEYAVPYFLAVAVPTVFLSLMLVLASALRGAGDTKTPLKVALIANVVNAILDYVLIFGFFIIPGLGIVGAGLATTASRIVGVIILFLVMKRGKGKIIIDFHSRWQLNKTMLSSICNISLPAAYERLIMRAGQLVYGGIIIQVGTVAYASHIVAGTIETLSYLPGMGFGVAAATLVGQKLGAGRPGEARRIGLAANWLATMFMVFLGLFFFIFAPFLAGIFTQDTEVKDLTANVLRIIALFQPFLCMTLVITSALQGAGDTRYPMYTTFIGIWGIRVLGGYFLGIVMGLGLIGIWLAYALDVTVRGLLLTARFNRGEWKHIKV